MPLPVNRKWSMVNRIKKSIHYSQFTINCKSKGFSLVELLIGIAILASISVVVFQIYLSHFKIFSGQSLAISVASENQIAMDEITNTARQAVEAPAACNRLICDSTANASSCIPISACFGTHTRNNRMQLVLKLWPLDSNGNPFDPATQGG